MKTRMCFWCVFHDRSTGGEQWPRYRGRLLSGCVPGETQRRGGSQVILCNRAHTTLRFAVLESFRRTIHARAHASSHDGLGSIMCSDDRNVRMYAFRGNVELPRGRWWKQRVRLHLVAVAPRCCLIYVFISTKVDDQM